MFYSAGEGNSVDASVQISARVTLGSYNRIGKNVVIEGFKGAEDPLVTIGDCNDIHDNTRILAGPEGISVGDWNVFHNSMLIMGGGRLEIGHNCWFGQNTVLDSAGGLYLGNGVRVGLYCQVWTHAASGELIEGCTLFAVRPTRIEDEVWLMGNCIVGSGVQLARRSIFLTGSVITRSSQPGRVYRGSPAQLVPHTTFWRSVSLDEKLEMMRGWAREFVAQSAGELTFEDSAHAKTLAISHPAQGETLLFGVGPCAGELGERTTYFDLENKTYTKRLTPLERRFYRYVYDHKARFLPAALRRTSPAPGIHSAATKQQPNEGEVPR